MVTKVKELWGDFLTLLSWKGGEIRWAGRWLWGVAVWLSRIPGWVIRVAVPAVFRAAVGAIRWLIKAIWWLICQIPWLIGAIATTIKALLNIVWFLLPGVVVLGAFDLAIKLLGSSHGWPLKVLGIAGIIIVVWMYWNVLGVSVRKFKDDNVEEEDEDESTTAKTCLALAALLMSVESIVYAVVVGCYFLFLADPIWGTVVGLIAFCIMIRVIVEIAVAVVQ